MKKESNILLRKPFLTFFREARCGRFVRTVSKPLLLNFLCCRIPYLETVVDSTLTRQLIERRLVETTLDRIKKEEIYSKIFQSHLDFLQKKESSFCSFHKEVRLENLNFYRTKEKSDSTDENLDFTQEAG